MCNLSGEAFVVHQEEVNFSDVVDKELLEAVGEEVASLVESGYEGLYSKLKTKQTFALLP